MIIFERRSVSMAKVVSEIDVEADIGARGLQKPVEIEVVQVFPVDLNRYKTATVRVDPSNRLVHLDNLGLNVYKLKKDGRPSDEQIPHDLQTYVHIPPDTDIWIGRKEGLQLVGDALRVRMYQGTKVTVFDRSVTLPFALGSKS